jgi:hypothetical protein
MNSGGAAGSGGSTRSGGVSGTGGAMNSGGAAGKGGATGKGGSVTTPGTSGARTVGTWSGVTNQYEPIEFDIDASGTTIARIRYEWTASGCSMTGTTTIYGTIPISSTGSFTTTSGSCPSATVSGTFGSTTATGLSFLTFSSSQACSCEGTLGLTWSASAAM